MKMLHEGPGCHRGVHKLTALFQERFWMPSARPDGEGLRDQDRSLGPYRSPPSLANPLHERDGLKYAITFNDNCKGKVTERHWALWTA